MNYYEVNGIPIEIIRKNIKNMYLRVLPPEGRVVISAPIGMSERDIRKFVEAKSDWILIHQKRILQRLNEKNLESIDSRQREALMEDISRLISHWESILGVKSSAFTIRDMKTRWGSCNIRTHKLSFNLQLARKSPECLEYVVVHELVHLLEGSHNKRFKAYMDHFLPNWRILKKELND